MLSSATSGGNREQDRSSGGRISYRQDLGICLAGRGSDRASSASYRAPRNSILSQAVLSGRRRARICLIILVCAL